MDIISLLVSWLIPSIIAAIGIMLSNSIIEHRLELKHALIMGLAANFLPELIKMFYGQIYGWIPYGSIVLNLALWIILATIIMSESGIIDRVKIGGLGFLITQVLLIIIPMIYSFF
jgi:hypothetical protein